MDKARERRRYAANLLATWRGHLGGSQSVPSQLTDSQNRSVVLIMQHVEPGSISEAVSIRIRASVSSGAERTNPGRLSTSDPLSVFR